MLLLSIIGIIVMLVATYIIITAIDAYSKKTYDYEFFNAANFTLAFIANVMLYFGYKWYIEALAKSGDKYLFKKNPKYQNTKEMTNARQKSAYH